MIETTYTIKCDDDIVAKSVPEYYVCMIVQSVMTRFSHSAAEGDLRIGIIAENHGQLDDDDIELPF
jgi:hypothetical protein